jgi:hypothetical protein
MIKIQGYSQITDIKIKAEFHAVTLASQESNRVFLHFSITQKMQQGSFTV